MVNFNDSNTTLKSQVGFVLHGLEGACMPLEDGTGTIATDIATDPIGCPVKKDPLGQAKTFIYAETGEDAEGFVAYEPAPSKASRSVIMFQNGMDFVGKTAVDSSIVAGDKITAKDGLFVATVTVGDKIIGECFEDGVNSADATYGTIAIKVVDRYSLGVGGSGGVTKSYVDSADNALQTKITEEETARTEADTALQDQIDA